MTADEVLSVISRELMGINNRLTNLETKVDKLATREELTAAAKEARENIERLDALIWKGALGLIVMFGKIIYDFWHPASIK